MARRTRAEAEATRDALLDAAEAVFLEKGYAHSTLEEMARRAGLTRGAIYWHFRNKADVFNALAARVRFPLEELVERIEQEPAARPLTTLRALCRYALDDLARDERRQRVYTILLHRLERTPGSLEALTYIQQTETRGLVELERLFEAARAAGDVDPGLAPKTAAWALQAYLYGLYARWLREPAEIALAEQADTLLDFFFDGLAANVPAGADAAPDRRAARAQAGRSPSVSGRYSAIRVK
jgi:AcrR family transcriptional regulator